MSPILVRPVREQLEHDRVIRLLQAKYKRKFDVAINPGNEQGTPVGVGPSPWYPDLVLQSTERSHKLLGVVEVETVESINHLEAMSQWVAFSRLKAPFYLYVPAGMVDVARRFCTDLQISVTEIWAYHTIGDQIRFTPVQRAPGSDDGNGAGREARQPKAAAAVAGNASKAGVAKQAGSKATSAKAPAAKAPVAKSAGGRPGTTKPVAKKTARRPSPSAAKKVARSAKPVKAKTSPRPTAKKPVSRAAKRK